MTLLDYPEADYSSVYSIVVVVSFKLVVKKCHSVTGLVEHESCDSTVAGKLVCFWVRFPTEWQISQTHLSSKVKPA